MASRVAGNPLLFETIAEHLFTKLGFPYKAQSWKREQSGDEDHLHMACCIVLAMIMANLVGAAAWIRNRARLLAAAVLATSAATGATAATLSHQLTPTHFLADFGLLAFALPLCGS